MLCAALLLMPQAVASDVTEAQWDSIDTAALEDAGAGLTLDESFDFGEAVEQLLSSAGDTLHNAVAAATRSAVLLLIVVLFCEVANIFFAHTSSSGDVTTLVGVLAITAIAVTDVSSLIDVGSQTIGHLSDFSKLLIPVMTACSAAAGSVTAATARQAATLLFSNVLVTAIERVLMPFVYLYVSASVACAALDNEGLRAIARLFKWVITVTLTTLLMLFTIYLSVTNFAASGADAVTIKLTRTVISGMVPVVGGILSDASETVLAGAAMVRSTVGVFGAATVMFCCAGPFLYLGTRYLAYRLVSVLASLISKSKTARLIEEIGEAFALVLGMTGSVALLVMISLFATLSVAVN